MAKAKKPDHEQNLETEHEGVAFIRSKEKSIYVPDKDQRLWLLDIMGVSKKFVRTFDAIKLKVSSFEKIRNARDFELIEVKVTAKHLPKFPQGFFFGMTENEEMLMKVLEPNFQICLVSLHAKGGDYKMLTHTGLAKLVRNKRIQYQINL